jgi:D-sedoheptulose 7-phosphate isomerase
MLSHFSPEASMQPELCTPRRFATPGSYFTTPGSYLDEYVSECAHAFASIDRVQFDLAVFILTEAIEKDATIFVCGNGGSAAIANHMVCDHQKGLSSDTNLRPRVISLSANVEVMTAVSNDIGFADVFAYPLRLHARSGDVLVTISSSGNSENIVRALKAASKLKMQTIALTGFNGGRSRAMADAAVHVDAHNFGVVEDVHQSCMHALAQFLRHRCIPEELLSTCQF